MASLVEELMALTSKQKNLDAEHEAKVTDLQVHTRIFCSFPNYDNRAVMILWHFDCHVTDQKQSDQRRAYYAV